MFDPTDIFDAPKSVVLAVLRFLWWLGWELLVETVFWSIGWSSLRVLSLGRFPEERVTEQDAASGFTQFFVQVTGASVLGTAIWLLSGIGPNL